MNFETNKQREMFLINGEVKFKSNVFAQDITYRMKDKYRELIKKRIPLDHAIETEDEHCDLVVRDDEVVGWLELHDKNTVVALFDSIQNATPPITEKDKDYILDKLDELGGSCSLRDLQRKCGKWRLKRMLKIIEETDGVIVVGKNVKFSFLGE
jgi:hypothetical protein